MTRSDYIVLISAAQFLRMEAEEVGSMHGNWDTISDLESHAKGKPTMLRGDHSYWMREAQEVLKRASGVERPANGLSLAEVERLNMLIEECSEVIKCATKILRHGYESRHPASPVMTNRMELMKELGDVFAVSHIMIKGDDISETYVSEAAARGRSKKLKYTHHQGVDA